MYVPGQRLVLMSCWGCFPPIRTDFIRLSYSFVNNKPYNYPHAEFNNTSFISGVIYERFRCSNAHLGLGVLRIDLVCKNIYVL
jgi:hypothetical protein